MLDGGIALNCSDLGSSDDYRTAMLGVFIAAWHLGVLLESRRWEKPDSWMIRRSEMTSRELDAIEDPQLHLKQGLSMIQALMFFVRCLSGQERKGYGYLCDISIWLERGGFSLRRTEQRTVPGCSHPGACTPQMSRSPPNSNAALISIRLDFPEWAVIICLLSLPCFLAGMGRVICCDWHIMTFALSSTSLQRAAIISSHYQVGISSSFGVFFLSLADINWQRWQW